jgi:hypothetical protein
MDAASRVLCLCGGTQSSGSTLVSWCFLQRRDTDGILDANNDVLARVPTDLRIRYTWLKTTICCFRMTELIEHFRDEGWQIVPLLVVRDVRNVFASLSQKPYGRNGTTAEDPPLRLRLRRFREDWERFRREDWPILRYESLLQDPETVLRSVCGRMGMPWDASMLTWPKQRGEIANTRHGNKTFLTSLGRDLASTIRPESAKPLAISGDDLHWLEEEFAGFNVENHYPSHLKCADDSSHHARPTVSSFLVTRRFHWRIRQTPHRWFLHKLGFRAPAQKWLDSRWF